MVRFTGDTVFTHAIHDRTSSFYIDLLVDYHSESPMPHDVRTAAESFMSRCMAFRNEFPEAASGMWTMIGKDTVLRWDSIVCLLQHAYMFTGGAHGSTTIHFLIARSADGASLQWKDLVADTVAFSTVAEHAFRAQQGMRPSETYDSKGFWFKDEKFVLPKEIGVDSSGFVLLYNQYEIAPYSMGQIKVTIPYSEVITTAPKP
ncbi:MAG: RsiV family protein [Candidatus Kapabacteria bacterium]|nr:RsiV family protein [Candidatus Kapabacteria bacterium]